MKTKSLLMAGGEAGDEITETLIFTLRGSMWMMAISET